jgi:chromosome segregation ATPase
MKIICGEFEESKKRSSDLELAIKKLNSESENKVRMLVQECERLNSVVEKKNAEIRNLGGEVQEYQDNLRMSTAQANKLSSELNEFRNRLGATTQETETYKQRIQKLIS